MVSQKHTGASEQIRFRVAQFSGLIFIDYPDSRILLIVGRITMDPYLPQSERHPAAEPFQLFKALRDRMGGVFRDEKPHPGQ